MRRLLLALLLLLLPGVVEAQTQWQINNLLSQNACTTPTAAAIIGVNQGGPIFGLLGNVVSAFQPGTVATVSGSHGTPNNDGLYHVTAVSLVPFPFPDGQTLVTVVEAIPSVTPNFGTMSVGGGGSCSGASPITYVRDFGGDIQAAINATAAGGIVQLDCTTYNVGSTITINKAMTLKGCNAGFVGVETTFPAGVGTILSATSGIPQNGSVIVIDTFYGVTIEDVQIRPNNPPCSDPGFPGNPGCSVTESSSNNSGIFITCSACAFSPAAGPWDNQISKFNRVFIVGGDWGILGVPEKVSTITISNSVFFGFFRAAIFLQGEGGGTRVNCDGGQYTISENFMASAGGAAGTKGIWLHNSAAVGIIGNQLISFTSDIIRFTSADIGPNPGCSSNIIQHTIVGNQIEAGIFGNPGSGHAMSWPMVNASPANIQIVGNYINASKNSTIFITAAGPFTPSAIEISANNIRNTGGFAVIDFTNVINTAITGNQIDLDDTNSGSPVAVGISLQNASGIVMTGNTIGSLVHAVTTGVSWSPRFGGTAALSSICLVNNVFNRNVNTGASLFTNKYSPSPANGGCD